MFKVRDYFGLEKKSVFVINLFLILFVLVSFYVGLSLSYFFYTDIILTFIVSYVFFKNSRHLSKTLILTNIFIFFYFLYPNVANFLQQLLGNESYFFILFYNILLAYVFLAFSGYHNDFLGHVRKINLKILGIVVILGLAFGLFFFLVKEPFPSAFTEDSAMSLVFISKLIFWTIVLAISEQIIFSAFLLRSYEKLTSKHDAFFQVSAIFVLFHVLRFKVLISSYYSNFGSMAITYLCGYYFLLFLFMMTCLYFYSMRGKHEGSFVYPVLLHFVTDLFLFLLTSIK